MDEPLSNLDAQLRVTARGEIKRLQKQLGTTTLYVTHDQVEATTMADLVAVMRDGLLVQLGSPGEIYDRPTDWFVATFVGNPPMNVLAASGLDRERRAIRVADAWVPLANETFGRCVAAEAVQLGVRPEDLALVEATEEGCIRGEIYVVEPMGSETLVEVKVGSARVIVRAGRGWERPIGSPVGIKIDAASACFFDAAGATVVHRMDRTPGVHLERTPVRAS